MLLGSLSVLAVACTPFWLPRAVLAIRMRIFTRVNGSEGIPIPGPQVDATRFRAVYAHPAADGRSRGAALSDLFWYWLSPGPEIHQEHLEAGPRYEEVARATRRLLAVSRAASEALAARCAARVLGRHAPRRTRLVRLRDLMMPVWAEFYYELVFGEPCPEAACALIVANADDVVTALKCCGLRHMDRRDRLTEFLVHKVEQGGAASVLPELGSTREQALYLQGVFFNTAVVQMSEAMTHLLMAVAKHRQVRARLLADPHDDQFLDAVINETLRQYPLFGVAHRITSNEIVVDGDTTIAKGAVLCFNHAEYQRSGFDDPDRFDPSRWERLNGRDATFIPFGVVGNRPCPAQAVALVTMRVAARAFLCRYDCVSSAAHTRSVPNRGPCVIIPRDRTPPRPMPRLALLALLAVRDRWEDVWRSLVQLVLGTVMVLHARRLRLCQQHFEPRRCPAGHGSSRNGDLTSPNNKEASS